MYYTFIETKFGISPLLIADANLQDAIRWINIGFIGTSAAVYDEHGNIYYAKFKEE